MPTLSREELLFLRDRLVTLREEVVLARDEFRWERAHIPEHQAYRIARKGWDRAQKLDKGWGGDKAAKLAELKERAVSLIAVNSFWKRYKNLRDEYDELLVLYNFAAKEK